MNKKQKLTDVLSVREIEVFFLQARRLAKGEPLKFSKEDVLNYVNKVEAEVCSFDYMEEDTPWEMGLNTMNDVMSFMEDRVGFYDSDSVGEVLLELKEDFALEIRQNLPAELWRYDKDEIYHNHQRFRYGGDHVVICNGRGKCYRCEG